jgi:chromosome partitioning protein
MKIIAIMNQKGGCGKTTTAVNLAHALSKQGLKTLLIDLDPQAHTTFSLGIRNTKGICELIEAQLNSISFSLREHATQRDENLFVISSSVGLSALDHKLSILDDKLFIMYKILSQPPAWFDYCIIDCPPNLGVLTLNAFFAATFILVPLTACSLAMKGVGVLNQIIQMMTRSHPSSPVVYYLLTQYDRRFRYSLHFLEEIRAILKDKLLSTTIRTNINLREAASEQKSIFEHKPYSRGAHDYFTLSEELRQITEKTQWARFFFKGKELQEIFVVGDFNKWQKDTSYKMKKLDQENWTLNISLPKGTYRYKFLVDQHWINDPINQLQEDDSYGGRNSVLMIR